MKRLFLLLAGIVLPAVTAAAQTSSAPAGERILEIHRFNWFEATAPTVDHRDAGYQMAATMKWRREHAPGRGDFMAWVVLKNVSRKPIKSVSIDFVFRDSATEKEFLRYHLRFDRRIGPGQKKEVRHTIKKGREPDSFSPAAPGEALLDYTKSCGDRSVYVKNGKLVERKVREGEKPIPDFCYARPAVTRIDYEDGTFWQP